jgi:hypothetical protein
MARPAGKKFPVPVMVKTTEAMKARLDALAARTPLDVSVGFSVVARRAIAIGLEVLERDPRMILEPSEGDAEAARDVLSKVFARAAELRAEGLDAGEAGVQAAMERFASRASGAYDVIPAQEPHGEANGGGPRGQEPPEGKGSPRGTKAARAARRKKLRDPAYYFSDEFAADLKKSEERKRRAAERAAAAVPTEGEDRGPEAATAKAGKGSPRGDGEPQS